MINIDGGMMDAVRDLYRSMETDELLSKALDLLNEHGWGKGEFIQENGAMCIFGALNAVACDGAQYMPKPDDRHYAAWTEAKDLICAEIQKEAQVRGWQWSAPDAYAAMGDIPTFNDAKDVTFEDVTLVFKRAIGEIAGD